MTPATAPKMVSKFQGQGDETIRIAEVRLRNIKMPGFQRERQLRQIQKIQAEFDLTSYAFPSVALYKDELLAIDGQQRCAALEAMGHETAWVLIIEGVRTPERLAVIFLRINRDRKLLNALQKYVGAKASKDSGTLDIDRIVSQFGKTISKSATSTGKLPAGAVVRIHERGGNLLLERVLRILEMAWGNTPSVEAHEGKTLLGIAAFLHRYREAEVPVDDDRLITVLRRHHPGYLLDHTEKRDAISYADYLRDEYNRGLRGKQKL